MLLFKFDFIVRDERVSLSI